MNVLDVHLAGDGGIFAVRGDTGAQAWIPRWLLEEELERIKASAGTILLSWDDDRPIVRDTFELIKGADLRLRSKGGRGLPDGTVRRVLWDGDPPPRRPPELSSHQSDASGETVRPRRHTRTPVLSGLGHTEARHRLQEIRPLFFSAPAEPFVPDLPLKSP